MDYLNKMTLAKTAFTVFLAFSLVCLVVLLFYTGHSNLPKHFRRYNEDEDSVVKYLNGFLVSKVRNILIESGLNVSFPNCPIHQPLESAGEISVDVSPVPAMKDLERNLEDRNISIGGHWKPLSCAARHKIAIILPFRERREHLKIFLRHMHPFLQQQNLEYGIYVIEQDFGEEFNRGALLNIGFVLANKDYGYECYFFHDIDNLPADARIPYSCPNFPFHMATSVEKFGYNLPYEGYVGGVFAIRKEQFKTINGFSNVYFGWGAEDDDLWQRITNAQLPIKRYVGGIFRFHVIPHKQNKAADDRMKYLQQAKSRFGNDGLSNLNYSLIKFEKKTLYTWAKVQLDRKVLRNVE